LVEQVEIGDLTGPVTRALLKGYVTPLLAAGCDTIILGCTHYPFLKPLLKELLPAGITLIDTGSAVARRLGSLIHERNQMATGAPSECRFWTSGDVEQFSAVLPNLWGKVASVETLSF
jgi:glutamate racemase